MSKHTPGPWRALLSSGYIYSPDVVVARVGDYADAELLRHSRGRWDADTQLIASAPDMLEALERLAKAVILPSGSIIGLMREDFIAARVAIAKAKGELI